MLVCGGWDRGPFPPFISPPQTLPGPQNPVQWPLGKTLASETLCAFYCVKSTARAALWCCLAVSLWGLGHQTAWSIPCLGGKAVRPAWELALFLCIILGVYLGCLSIHSFFPRWGTWGIRCPLKLPQSKELVNPSPSELPFFYIRQACLFWLAGCIVSVLRLVFSWLLSCPMIPSFRVRIQCFSLHEDWRPQTSLTGESCD